MNSFITENITRLRIIDSRMLHVVFDNEVKLHKVPLNSTIEYLNDIFKVYPMDYISDSTRINQKLCKDVKTTFTSPIDAIPGNACNIEVEYNGVKLNVFINGAKTLETQLRDKFKLQSDQ